MCKKCRYTKGDKGIHAMAAKEETDKKETEAAPKKSKKKLFIFGGIGLLVVLLGVGIPMMMGGKEEGHEEEVVEEPPKVYKQAKLDTFIVNLSDAKNFLKVAMLLEYDPEILAKMAGGGEHGGGHGGGEAAYGGSSASGGGASGGAADPFAFPHELEGRLPIIKDAILRVLSSKRSEQVLTVEGKAAIKEEIMEAVNEAIGYEEPPIVNVYFTEFIVQ